MNLSIVGQYFASFIPYLIGFWVGWFAKEWFGEKKNELNK